MLAPCWVQQSHCCSKSLWKVNSPPDKTSQQDMHHTSADCQMAVCGRLFAAEFVRLTSDAMIIL